MDNLTRRPTRLNTTGGGLSRRLGKPAQRHDRPALAQNHGMPVLPLPDAPAADQVAMITETIPDLASADDEWAMFTEAVARHIWNTTLVHLDFLARHPYSLEFMHHAQAVVDAATRDGAHMNFLTVVKSEFEKAEARTGHRGPLRQYPTKRFEARVYTTETRRLIGELNGGVFDAIGRAIAPFQSPYRRSHLTDRSNDSACANISEMASGLRHMLDPFPNTYEALSRQHIRLVAAWVCETLGHDLSSRSSTSGRREASFGRGEPVSSIGASPL